MSATADLPAMALAHRIVARLRDDLDRDPPVYHPSTRDPRESGAPMALTPPRMGARDADAARVAGRWIAAATPKLTWRGVRVHFMGGWHG